MDTMSQQDVAILLERAGVTPASKDIEEIRSLWEKFLERLSVLHAVDLENEAVAGLFPAEESSG